MTNNLIDGKIVCDILNWWCKFQFNTGNAIAATIRQEVKLAVDDMKMKYNCTPGLAVVLVGDRRDSATYVRMKKKACAEVGVRSIGIDLPADISQDKLLQTVGTGN